MSIAADLSAAEAIKQFAAGELSPVQVTNAVFERMDRWEPHINAMYRRHTEQALQAANASEKRWQRNTPLSALDGVPVTLKENIDTIGDPRPSGTAATVLQDKTADAPLAARLRAAGCVLTGKTTMPDFGMLSSGLSSIHGLTRNPWQLDRNTSGSSSGAAAAAAAGYGPLHIGTDIGGSVRLPATHCGLFGLKPSHGRVPVNPPYMGRVAGPMTRTVTDSALLMEIISQPDQRDFMSLPHQPVNYAKKLNDFDIKGLKIGLMTSMNCGMDPESTVVDASIDAAGALSAAGAIVEPVNSFMTAEMLEGFCVFFEARSCSDINKMDEQTRIKILPFIVEWATWRANSFTGTQVVDAYTQLMAMREAAVTATNEYDFVISPVSPILPYPADQHCPGDDPHNALPHIAFTVAYNMSEQPAASINWTYHNGLPVGVQIVGRRFDDLGVLQVSRLLEQLRGPQRDLPKAPAL